MKECVKRELVLLYMEEIHKVNRGQISDIHPITFGFMIDYTDGNNERIQLSVDMWDVLEWDYNTREV